MGRFELLLLAEASSTPNGTSHALAIVLWVGLGLLSVSLLILMRTRWGQAQPLAKCAALSVFAHTLFFAYAYTTRLIFDSSSPEHEQYIRLALVSHDAVDSPQPPAQNDWNRFASEFTIAPDVASPAPLEVADAADVPQPPVPQPEFAVDASETLVEALTEVTTLPEPPLPPPPAMIQAPAPSLIEVEPPSPEPPAEEVATVPSSEPLERLAVESSVDQSVSESAAAESFDAAPDEASLQRLADVEINAPLAEALPSTFDQPDAASNRKHLPENAGGDVGAQAGAPVAADRDLAEARPNTPVRRLGDGQPLPQAYRARMARNRLGLIKQQGGSEQTEEAVEAALAWLAANQAADGRWDADQFGAGREAEVLGHDRQGSGAEADTGITGLALLAFLSAGHTHFEGQYRRTVQHGLEYLLGEQAADGNLAGDARLFARMYCHGMASLAASEAYAMTGDHRIRPYVESATQYTIRAQHPQTGGWRYKPAERGDMSQFGWQVMALRSAELAGIKVPGETRGGMHRFLASVSRGEHGGLASYRPNERVSRTMTAEALACRYFLGVHRDRDTIGEAARYLMGELPADGQANLYYWYYGTLSLHQTQTPEWFRWNQALQQQLLSRQRRDGSAAGSWDPDTVWGSYGGRVYTTALAALCLEVYYRYLPVYE